MRASFFLCLALILVSRGRLWSQKTFSEVQRSKYNQLLVHLEANSTNYGLKKEDVGSLALSDCYATKPKDLWHVYVQQKVNNIEIFNAISTGVIFEGNFLDFKSRVISDASGRINAKEATITPKMALEKALAYFNLEGIEGVEYMGDMGAEQQWTCAKSLRKPVAIRLVYVVQDDNSLKLCYNLSIAPKKSNDIWQIRMDATDGRYIEKNNWTVHCNVADAGHQHSSACNHHHAVAADGVGDSAAPAGLNGSSYNVFPLPLESPLSGSRSLLSDPFDVNVSPLGWHNDNTSSYTITRGNNAYVYIDTADTNNPGYSPNGTSALNFNFPFNSTNAPISNVDAIVTQLFYSTNRIHDITYGYGFDENAGNFQKTNLDPTNTGGENDPLLGESLDGGGTNNANMATPPDGFSPRMQMYQWRVTNSGTFRVTAPSNLAGTYTFTDGSFAPTTTGLTGNLILVNDGTGTVTDACTPIQNNITGKVAVIDRGTCVFVDKCLAAQQAGAIAVVICNNVSGAPISMGGASTQITIPCVMLSQTDCNSIKVSLNANTPVSINLASGIASFFASDFESGVVAHEFTHGISNRLTGGPAAANCLQNAEQMGEGWSDYLGLLLTQTSSTNRTRGIGNYLRGQPSTGGGIRSFPYSTDMTINPLTYGNLASSTGEVHFVGEIWCAMLWDLTWKLVDRYGYDADLVGGTKGNSIALKLVMDAMKLQPCSPGFVDGRDAILLADQINNCGANQCLIWEVFARRGLGATANQNSSSSHTDGVTSFTLPASCSSVTAAPTPTFSASVNCFNVATFTNTSLQGQSYRWVFSDGSSSCVTSPTHQFTGSAPFSATLTATNSLGSRTVTQSINLPSLLTPAVMPVAICVGQNASLLVTGLASGELVEWTLPGGSTSYSNPLSITNPITSANYTVRKYNASSLTLGSQDLVSPGSFDTQSAPDEGVYLITGNKKSKLISVDINSNVSASYTISLIDAQNTVLQTLNTPARTGARAITLNWTLQPVTSYRLSVTSNTVGLWKTHRTTVIRSNPGLCEILMNSNRNVYPYFFNIVVDVEGCSSSAATAQLTVNPVPTVTIAPSGPTTICAGSALVLTASGAATYRWSTGTLTPSFTVTNSGNYNVTGTTALGCTATVNATSVTVNPAPAATFTSQPTSTSGSYQFTNTSTGASTHQWNFGNGTTSTSLNPTNVYAQSGSYTVTLVATSAANCAATVTQVLNNIIGSNETTQTAAALTISPNPTTGLLDLHWNNQQNLKAQKLQLMDIQGRHILEKQITDFSQSLQLDLSTFDTGVYILRVGASAFRVIKE